MWCPPDYAFSGSVTFRSSKQFSAKRPALDVANQHTMDNVDKALGKRFVSIKSDLIRTNRQSHTKRSEEGNSGKVDDAARQSNTRNHARNRNDNSWNQHSSNVRDLQPWRWQSGREYFNCFISTINVLNCKRISLFFWNLVKIKLSRNEPNSIARLKVVSVNNVICSLSCQGDIFFFSSTEERSSVA